MYKNYTDLRIDKNEKLSKNQLWKNIDLKMI